MPARAHLRCLQLAIAIAIALATAFALGCEDPLAGLDQARQAMGKGTAASGAAGQDLALFALGGYFDPPDPTIDLSAGVAGAGANEVGGTVTFIPGVGFSGNGQVSGVFVDGYPCEQLGANFVVP